MRVNSESSLISIHRVLSAGCSKEFREIWYAKYLLVGRIVSIFFYSEYIMRQKQVIKMKSEQSTLLYYLRTFGKFEEHGMSGRTGSAEKIKYYWK